MAIDTAEKRRSAASVGGPFWIPGVTPTALPDAEWRQQAGWGYSGIPASEAVTPVITTEMTFTVPAITRTFTVPALTTTFTVPDPE